MAPAEPKMQATVEEMAAANIAMESRDFCAHILIKLNECRRSSKYVPWKCEHERHEYELCQYKDYKRRVALAQQQHEAEA